jgi:hypothetical protein
VINFLESGCILWSVDEVSGKWMKTAVSSEADEINSMSEWPDLVAQRNGPTERPGWPVIPGGRVGQMDTRAGAQRRVDGRSLGADRCPMEGGSRGVAQWQVLGVARRGSI